MTHQPKKIEVIITEDEIIHALRSGKKQEEMIRKKLLKAGIPLKPSSNLSGSDLSPAQGVLYVRENFMTMKHTFTWVDVPIKAQTT